MADPIIKRFAFWEPATWAIPKLYWDAFSQEQRIHAICKQLSKVIGYADYLGVNVDDIAQRLKAIEDGQLDPYIIAAIEQWFEDNEPAIVNSIEAINDALPIADYDSAHTVSNAISAIADALPIADYDIAHTVSDAISAANSTINTINAALPIADYDSAHTVSDAISAANSTINTVGNRVNNKPTKAVYIGNSYLYYTNGLYDKTHHLFDSASEYYSDGAGFQTYTNHSTTFNDLVNDAYNSMTATQRAAVTHVIIISAIGDARWVHNQPYTGEVKHNRFLDISNVANSTATNAKTKFPNAEVFIYQADFVATGTYLNGTSALGYCNMSDMAIVCKGLEYAPKDYQFLGWGGWNLNHYLNDDIMDGTVHPNNLGFKMLANQFINAFKHGCVTYKDSVSYADYCKGYIGGDSNKEVPVKVYNTYRQSVLSFQQITGSDLPASGNTFTVEIPLLASGQPGRITSFIPHISLVTNQRICFMAVDQITANSSRVTPMYGTVRNLEYKDSTTVEIEFELSKNKPFTEIERLEITTPITILA